MKGKYITFFNQLVDLVETLNTDVVKLAIGDSTNNNRTLSVNQLIRFLSSRRTVKLKTLAVSLENVYNMLRPTIVANRANFRTDAIDINEFIHAYQDFVINSNNVLVKRNIGTQVNVAA